jgi:Uma2 family endonuclease
MAAFGILRDTVCMASATLIPVGEYLKSSYEPDCDYIEGELQERNVGERPHNAVQYILTERFNRNRREWKVVAFQEQRVQVSDARFRIPDVAVLRRSDPADDIVQKAPLICIEVLSPEDRLQRIQERFADYARMGVENMWLIDPLSRHAWVVSADGSQQRVNDAFTVSGTPIRIDLTEVFVELDEMQSNG